MNSWQNLDQEALRQLLPLIRQGECQEYVGYRDRYGYGRVRSRRLGLDVKAHRLAFWLANGYLPELVRHRCDNPPCCLPEHLLAGDHQANAADMMERGRHVPRPKVLPDGVRAQIRIDYARGGHTYRSLAARHDVAFGTIQRILVKEG